MSAYTDGMQQGWDMGVKAVLEYITYRMTYRTNDESEVMRELDLIQDYTRRLIDDE